MTWITANKIVKLIQNDRLSEIQRILEPYSLGERQRIISEKVKRWSLLYFAVKDIRLSIVNYFLNDCGVKPNYLWLAAATASLPIVKSLLGHGADIDSVDAYHRTALFKACWSSYFDIVKYLLDNGADINKADYQGTTSLMASLRNVDLCDLLLTEGALVDQMNAQGKTALMLAVESRNMPCIQTLLSFKADASRTNAYGEDAIFLAADRNQNEILETLTSHGYRITNEVALINVLKSCHLSVSRHLNKADTFWKAAMSLQGLPTDTPIFQTPDLFNTDERLRDVLGYFESTDGRAVAFLESRLKLLNPYTLTLLGEAATGIRDLDDFTVVFRFFFDVVKSAGDRLFFKTFLENGDMFERFARRNATEEDPELRFSRLSEMLNTFASHLLEAERRIRNMSASEKQFSLFYMESYFCSFLDLMLTIEELHPRELHRFADIYKSLVYADPRSYGSASLLHICIIKRYPTAITKMLLSSGADLNCQDNEGRTPVDYAIESPVYRTKSFIDTCLQHGLRFAVCHKDDSCLACYLNKGELLRTPVRYISLQCLAATVVATTRINYEHCLPPNLQIMVYTHS